MDNGFLSDLRESIANGLQSKSLTTCSRWAEKRRIMGSPIPGPYSFKYHPWCREIHNSRAEWNICMKGAQLGVTEVGINRAFYILDVLKRDVLYVLPTAQVASDFSKGRFSTALKHSPYLSSIFTDVNTVNFKQAGTSTLYIRGSRGESNLVSIPVSELILDEVDRMDQSEIWLALERLSGQIEKGVLALSTPTRPNHGIHELFKDSTQDHYTFECPHCSKRTVLVWPECFEIVGDGLNDSRLNDSYIKCRECEHKLEHESKPEWLANGEWDSAVRMGTPDRRGFYINQLYSFTVSPREIAEAYFRGFGDESARTEFHNSKLGLPYVGEGAQLDDTQLESVIGSHSIKDPPPMDSSRLITMGVDQGKWSYAVVTEWTFEELDADLNARAFAKDIFIGRFYQDEWDKLDEWMKEWQVLACVMDADPNINDARRFARRFPGHVWLCRYRSGRVGREITVSEEATASPMATVDRTNWMDAALGRFRTGQQSLPHDTPDEFLRHMKSPVRVYEKDAHGNYYAVYRNDGPDHYAHAKTYSEIALPLAASITTNRDIARFL